MGQSDHILSPSEFISSVSSLLATLKIGKPFLSHFINFSHYASSLCGPGVIWLLLGDFAQHCFDPLCDGFSVLLKGNLIFRFPFALMNCVWFEIDQDCWQGGRPGGQLTSSASTCNDIPALSLPCCLDSISTPYGARSREFAVEIKTKGWISQPLQRIGDRF